MHGGKCRCQFRYIGRVSSRRQPRFERATRSLATFVCSHRSLRSLAPQRAASLRSLCSLALFMGSLTHFARFFVGWLELMHIDDNKKRVLKWIVNCLLENQVGIAL